MQMILCLCQYWSVSTVNLPQPRIASEETLSCGLFRSCCLVAMSVELSWLQPSPLLVGLFPNQVVWEWKRLAGQSMNKDPWVYSLSALDCRCVMSSCLSYFLDFFSMMNCYLDLVSQVNSFFSPLSYFWSGYFITSTEMKLDHFIPELLGELQKHRCSHFNSETQHFL